MKFILLKTAPSNHSCILDVFKMLLGNAIKINFEDELLVLSTSDFKEEEIKQTVHSLEDDLNIIISLYCSNSIYGREEYNLIKNLFLQVKPGYYSFKTLIMEAKDIPNSKEVFNYLLAQTGVDMDIITAMASADLNVSVAAKELFMHRNTLLYKIERLLTLRNFDLRCFWDVVLLLKLSKH